MSSFVTIARILRPRGIRGEVTAVILTDFPERFDSTERVRIVRNDREFWESVERHWFHKGRIILKFQGRNNPDEVQELAGGEVQVPESERVEPPEGTFFHSDLLNCRVFESGDLVGVVSEIFEAGTGGDNLVVTATDGRRLMLPLAAKFVHAVNVEQKRIDVQIPAGLWEVAEEGGKKARKVKKRQAGRR